VVPERLDPGRQRRPTANGTNALTASPWVIWTVWGQMLTADNSDADVKATYYTTGQVYTGDDGEWAPVPGALASQGRIQGIGSR
jgi:hypothetical protein